MSIVSSLGGLVGMAVGGPTGAAIGSGLGSLLDGGDLSTAISSGLGSLLNPIGGTTGAGVDLLAAMSGGGGNQARGQNVQSMFNTVSGGGSPMEAMAKIRSQQGQDQYGGVTQGIGNLLDISGITKGGKINDPILAAIVLDQITKPKPAMTPLQQRQYDTGERLPDYRGTPVPDVPRVRFAQGGYIEGPGTGTSDSIPAMIYQNGGPVQEAALSDGEFVMTAGAVRGAGSGDRDRGAAKMYRMMKQFEGMA